MVVHYHIHVHIHCHCPEVIIRFCKVLGGHLHQHTGRHFRHVFRIFSYPAGIGEFLEYIPINGVVTPKTTVFLDIEEGGRVDEIFVEGGQPIEKGDLILRFSNAALQKESINAESRLLDNINQLRNTKISLAEKKLTLEDSLLDINNQIQDLKRKHDDYKVLLTNGDISEDDYESVRDQLFYKEQKSI